MQPNESDQFGRLLKGAISSIAGYEGRTTARVEEDLGSKLGVAAATIQRYKAGSIPPDLRSVELLAEEAMSRAYLTPKWLEKFLRAARHPGWREVLQRFTTPDTEQVRRIRRVHNLPRPAYTQFVPRPSIYKDIVEGLEVQAAVVALHGLGGNGKTSLALHVANQCFGQDSPVQQFDAIVWVSDEPPGGKLNLSILLDTVARTLDFPGYAQLAFSEKLYEVEQLLRANRTLIIVDNYETVTDTSLLDWMLHLPQPSKGIIATREVNRHQFMKGAYSVAVRGMSDKEAQTLVAERLKFLGISHLVSEPSQLAPLLAATEGNPKAIGLALGHLKYSGRPLQQVVDDIYQARGDLFVDLFARSWELLNEPAKHLLMAMTLFSGSVSNEALSAVAGVHGYDYDQAKERLIDLALLDMREQNLVTSARYSLHALVRAFATARLHERADVEQLFYERWVNWYVEFTNSLQDAQQHLEKIDLIEAEQTTLEAVIQWCYQHKRHTELSQIADVVGFYYHVRGMWEKKPSLHTMDAEIAQQHQDYATEARALAYLVQLLSRQEKLIEAYDYLVRLRSLVKSTELPDTTIIEYLIAESYYGNNQGEYDAVLELWQKYQHLQHSPKGHMVRTGMADCLYSKGDRVNARALYEESLRSSMQQNIQRGIISIQLMLISIYLDMDEIDQAEQRLNDISEITISSKDRRYIALLQRLYARLYEKRGLIDSAQAALAEAADLYKRLGMKRELQEVNKAFAILEHS